MTAGDSEVRYLRLRADTLMGLFRYLPEPARAQALAALVRSTAEHGGDSARRYFEAGGDTASLLAMIETKAAELGWGTWRFALRDPTHLDLKVVDSPFAAGYGAADTQVCAPITGMLQAVAALVLRGACEVREVQCGARGASVCRFEASSRTQS